VNQQKPLKSLGHTAAIRAALTDTLRRLAYRNADRRKGLHLGPELLYTLWNASTTEQKFLGWFSAGYMSNGAAMAFTAIQVGI
jgi:hypothetical protein